MKNQVLLGLIFFTVISCSDNSTDVVEEKVVNVDPYAGVEEELDGGELLTLRCNSCHNTQGTDNMLAPPMHRVKAHYVDDETSREEFVQAVMDWVKNPTEEKSLMPGARHKFGLMPKQDFDPKEVEAIAGYIYDNEM